MRILAQATNQKLGTSNDKIGDIIRTVLGIVGTLITTFGFIDVTPEEWGQAVDYIMVAFGAITNLIALVSGWFNESDAETDLLG